MLNVYGFSERETWVIKINEKGDYIGRQRSKGKMNENESLCIDSCLEGDDARKQDWRNNVKVQRQVYRS